ncbi:MAG: helix-turn-helix domain-containing protein [Bacteroidota bacterium]
MSTTSHIPLISSIEAYNAHIQIAPPAFPDFDIKSFEENMKTVKLSMKPFRIQFFQLAILTSGGGEVSADGKLMELEDYSLFVQLPGQIITWDVPPNWKGYYISLKESFYTVQVEGFRGLYHLPYFKEYSPAITLEEPDAEKLLGIFSEIHKAVKEKGPHSLAIIKSYLNNLLTLSIPSFENNLKNSLPANATRSLGEQFKILVHKDINEKVGRYDAEPLKATSIAEKLFVSPKYLSEKVKKEIGVTPTYYIQNALIQEAQKLIHSTDLQVQEIAYQLGFQDASYFNRLFRKMTGTSPGKLRQN